MKHDLLRCNHCQLLVAEVLAVRPVEGEVLRRSLLETVPDPSLLHRILAEVVASIRPACIEP